MCKSSPKLTIKDECRQSNSFYLLVKDIVVVSLTELNRLSIAGEDSKSTCRWNIHAKCFKNCPYFKSKVPWGTKQSICESLHKNLQQNTKNLLLFVKKGLYTEVLFRFSGKFRTNYFSVRLRVVLYKITDENWWSEWISPYH